MGQMQAVKEDLDPKKDELAPGHTLMEGHYTIDAFLNAGGFGITYLARNSLDRKVVIKECFPGALCRRTATSVHPRSQSHTAEFTSIVSKFVDEARSLAKVKHPNVVGVHQVFEENQTAYMALDFIEGCDLLDMIQERKDLPEPEEIETILRKLLDAVSHIHAQNMLHRDISPDNILLKSDKEPILIDFGAARQDAAQSNRVLSELRVIKDGYSPQEFYVSGAEQGPYSDLYALAATFYHVITGETPVSSQTRLATVATGDADPYVPVGGRLPQYSEPFLRGIDKALAILPKDRFETAGHWLDLLNGTENPDQSVAPTHAKKKKAKAPAPRSDSAVPATAKKGKARMLAAIGLAVPIMGGVYVLQMNGESASAEQTVATTTSAEAAVSALIAESATTAVETPAVVETTAAVEAITEEPTPSPDLSAILNLSAAAVATQPKTSSPEPQTVIPLEQAELASLDEKDVSSSLAPAQEADVASALGLALIGGADPAPETPKASDEKATAEIDVVQSSEVQTAAVQSTSVPSATVQSTDEPNTTAPILASVSVPDTPAATTPVLVESFDLPQVTSAWSIDVTAIDTSATDVTYSIGGLPLARDAEVDTVLHKMMEAPAGDTLELSVLAGESELAEVIETVAVPVIHRTSFSDGTTFETRMIDGSWTTVVADVPIGSDLQINDILVGDLDSDILFNQRTSLPETLAYASAQNIERINLAVNRQGNMTASSIRVPR